MDNLVMSVVNEVLYKNKTDSGGNRPENCDGRELNRPNYQNQFRKKRLMVYELASAKDGPVGESLNSAKTHQQLSSLRMNTMSAGTTELAAAPESKGRSSEDTVQAADFAVLSLRECKNIKRLLDFPYSQKEAVCLGMQKSCHISQVFAVDEILKNNPSLDFTVKWSLNDCEPFVFQAVGTREQMQAAAELLNRRCFKKREAVIVSQPTAYLRKILNTSGAAIGTIEGLSYTGMLPGVADYCEKHKDCTAEYQICGSYLLISGSLHEVQELLQSLA